MYWLLFYRTVAKVSLSSSGKILETLQKDIPLESIPKALGGTFDEFNEPFAFDTSDTGPFYCPGEPSDPFTLEGKHPAIALQQTSAVASPESEERDVLSAVKNSSLSLSLESSSSSTSSLLVISASSEGEGEGTYHYAITDKQGIVDHVSVQRSASDVCVSTTTTGNGLRNDVNSEHPRQSNI